MRVIHMMSPTHVAYCGIAIDAGTRNEELSEQGMAHFCEHMMFKGTQKRRAWHILNRMEAVGGDLNAYTNKEETVVYAAFMKEHLARATELIADVVFNSTYPQHEIDKEAEVIVEEIESYNDTPSELIFDEFEDIIFKGHPLGHDILGTKEMVRSFRTEDALRFTQRLYRPERMVFFVFGNYSFEKVKKIVEKCIQQPLQTLPLTPPCEGGEKSHYRSETSWERVSTPLPPREGQGGGSVGSAGSIVREKGTHQAHVMIGCAAYPSNDKRRVALYFLNNLIGGPGMNSILNVALREHYGLVYTVESSLTNYTDTATFAIYFGCDTEDVEKCLRIVRKELDKLMQVPLTKRQFEAAMKQIRGQIGVACDNFENYALDMAKSFLHYNKFEGVEDTFQHLNQLTPELLQQVAQDLFSEQNLTTLIFK
ncbi:MAG: insulinase family protein [Bacteroidaceae bacterium]|nr:insulinase family protein [Bacteroidaceae bacterium]